MSKHSQNLEMWEKKKWMSPRNLPHKQTNELYTEVQWLQKWLMHCSCAAQNFNEQKNSEAKRVQWRTKDPQLWPIPNKNQTYIHQQMPSWWIYISFGSVRIHHKVQWIRVRSNMLRFQDSSKQVTVLTLSGWHCVYTKAKVLPQDPPKTCKKENPSISRVQGNRNASVANKVK